MRSVIPPRFGRRGAEPGGVKQPSTRFQIASTAIGFEIIDYDGRPVESLDDPYEARLRIEELNDAAMVGGQALAAALRVEASLLDEAS